MQRHLLSKFGKAMLHLGMVTSGIAAGNAYQIYYSTRRKMASSPQEQMGPNKMTRNPEMSEAYQQARMAVHPLQENNDMEIIKGQVIKELVVVDGAVQDNSVFYSQQQPGVEVVELSLEEDGLSQLNDILANYQNLKALHLISHAENGVIQLGNSKITAEKLKTNLETFAALNSSMVDGADLLLYGCDLANGQEGEELLEIIRGNTHVDIAASIDATGNKEFGGNWELEIRKGNIETDQPFSKQALKDFSSVLQLDQTLSIDGFTIGSYTEPNTATYGSYTARLSLNDGDPDNNSLWCSDYGDAQCYVDWSLGSTGDKQLYLDFTGGEQFNISSFQLYSSYSQNFRISSDQGDSQDVSISASASETMVSLNWNNITRLTIEKQDGSDIQFTRVDDFVLTNIQPLNNAPTISIDGTTLSYIENDAAPQIDAAGTVSDSDGDADWNGGTLEAQITANAEANDQISIADSDGDGTAITISGTNIFSNGIDIGDLSASGGTVTGGTKLTITFDADATNNNVQEVLQSIRYNNTSNDPGTSDRTITVTATDNSSGSNSDTRTISVTAVNDEPSLTATGNDPTFAEGGAAASLFTGASASTVESGQSISGFTITISNVNNGSNERMNVDGSTIILTHGTNGTTVGNSINYSVSVIGSTATVSLTGGSMSESAVQTVINGISYQNNSNTPTTDDRVVTITSMQDNGGTANGGDNTVALAIGSTVTVQGTNDEPTLTATGSNPTFTEGGSAAGLYSGSSVSTIESGQTITGFTLTITNVEDGSSEVLNVDGTAIALTNGNSGTTVTNSLSYSVSVSGTTATISLSGGTMSAAATQTLVDGMSYQNNSDVPSTSNRVVTITSLQDNGGTANGGDDTAALAVASTVTVVSVNDEPVLTATGDDPTFTEGGAAAGLYSSASANTIESGQTITGFTFTVSNVNNGSNERINLDGSTIVLTHGTSGTTASNSLSFSVSVIGSTATISLTGGSMSESAVQTVINGISYQNNSNTPTTDNRVVTITSMQDNGGTANGGDNTVALAIASTVTVQSANDEPTLTATGSNTTFTEGGSAAGLYSGSSVSTIESGQTITGFTLTITNVEDGSSEVLNVDGTAIALTNGNSGTTVTNSLSYSVSVSGTTASISLSGGTMSAAATQTLVDGMSYQNNSDVPSTSNRVVTITSLQDNGGTANGGDDTAALAVASTVTVVSVNDEPVLTATGDDPTFTEGGAAAGLYSSASANTIESGQTITGFTFTVSNVNNGSNERMNVDGSTIILTHGTNGTTVDNSINYSVSVIGSTATVSLTGGSMSESAAQTVINGMSYQNNSNTPTTDDRVVTITSMQDNGGTANGGDNTVALAIASTVTVQSANDEPTLTATGSNPTFTEGGSAAGLYSGSSASTIEAGQTIAGLTLTVTNVEDGSSEVLNIDGTTIALTNGNSGTTATNSLSYSVSVSGTTATISLSGGSMSTAATQTLVDGMSYQNNSDDPNTSNRVVTITSIQDDGGTANGGDDTAALSVASTIMMVAVNDEPSLTATSSDPSFTAGGSPVSIYNTASASTIESGQSLSTITLTISNVTDGALAGEDELLGADGSSIALNNANSGTTVNSGLSYAVSLIGSTATVSFSGGSLNTTDFETLINNITYENTAGSPTTTNRVVTITSVMDDGGTANGGDNTVSLAIASTVSVIIAPEMIVKGNGMEINDGDTTPATADSTDFGSLCEDLSHTVKYTIVNMGSDVLSITTPLSINGSHAADFSVVTQPATSVAVDDSTTFVVHFEPSASGTRTASISISNNDPDENPYNFNIQGTALANSSSLQTITACDSYVWNGQTFTSSGTYMDTIPNMAGCDSVMTLDLTINNSTSSATTITACDSYDWNGNTYTTSGTYMDTIPNTAGCDSVITLNLTIANSSSAVTDITTCDSYDWNGQTYSASGSYMDTIPNAAGCDSVMTLNLTILNSTTSSTNMAVCDSFNWRGSTYTTSGTYRDTIPNTAGCDSVMVLDLTILNSTSSEATITACNSYEWNGITYTSSGTYMDTIQNNAGCDSIMTLNLTIGNATSSETAITACDSYEWNGQSLTTSGIYKDTIANGAGCDSVMTLDLTIMNSSSSVTDVTACNNYEWNGQILDASGTYRDTILNTAGCDSVMTLNLTIITADTSVTESGNTLTSNATNATYQWIDCDNNNEPIAGATDQSFSPENNGNYAVIITQNGCSDTSSCHAVSITSIIHTSLSSSVTVYPNPTQGELQIDMGKAYERVNITIKTIHGQTVFTKEVGRTDAFTVDLEGDSGMYIMTIITNDGKQATLNVIKE